MLLFFIIRRITIARITQLHPYWNCAQLAILDTVTTSVDNRSKKVKACCLSGPTWIVDEQDPDGEEAREEPREEEGPRIGKVGSSVEVGPNISDSDVTPAGGGI